ncbi:p21-C-terminal region-binding protein-domain-containing protein [Pilobolus umbonatus]|nr:p21-C-terminal region-binding protein-domain-containing protein [Pilobolus umbonatus]
MSSLKRRNSEEEDINVKKVALNREDGDSDSSDDGLQDIVDVDFDFYNPDDIDYHALKKLLTQLFSSDAELINLGDIADILIEENQVGTTVKVDDQKSDPYAILSVINLNVQKCPRKNEKLYHAVQDIFSLSPEKPIGWIISERFINMPVEIMPPMYAMLQEEMKKAVEQNEPYTFEWYMFISKTYKEVMSTVDNGEEDDTGKDMSTNETFYFQSEDEIIAKYAQYQFDFKFTNNEKEQAADSRRAFSDFGIAPSRKLLFVHRSKFDDLINEISKTCTSTTA